MEGLTLQVEIIPSLVEATWHVQAVSWNLHVDYKLAINSLLFFQKSLVSAINCLPLHLSPASSLPSRCIFGISCAASIVSRSPGTPEWRKITLRLHVFHTSFLLCIDIYIYNAYANTYIYIYIIHTYTYVHKWINLYQDAIHDNRESHHHLLHHQWWNRSLHMTLFW